MAAETTSNAMEERANLTREFFGVRRSGLKVPTRVRRGGGGSPTAGGSGTPQGEAGGPPQISACPGKR